MRVRFVACFIIVLCTQAISSLSLHGNFSLEQRSLNLSNSNMQRKQPISTAGNYGNIKEGKFERGNFSIRRAHKGKGAKGGSNVNYRPDPRRSRNSAPSLIPWISNKGKSLIVLSKEITQWLDLWFGHAAAMKLLWRVCCPFGSTHKVREISLCNCAQRIPGSLLSEKFLV
ncbi:UPF0481 protein [Trifolium repens]|nr:UPF0481 protein [Trifolium repens]